MKICFGCGNIYTDDILAGQPCPIRDCIDKVTDIDENMLPIIQILNEKGFSTRNCCSGHFFEDCPRTYIQFWDEVCFDRLPTGFKSEVSYLSDDTPLTNIFKDHDTRLSPLDLQRQLWKAARVLLDWAERLEDNFEEDEL